MPVSTIANAHQVELGAYQAIFEASPDPMWILDEASLRFFAVNEAAVSAYGYSREEFGRMTLRDIRPRNDIPIFLASVRPEGQDGETVWTHLRKDGGEILVTVFSTSTSFDGAPAQAVIVRDVTQKVVEHRELTTWKELLERRVAERTSELVAANEELEAFGTSVSHDLRSPLRAIDGFSRAILEDFGDVLNDEGKDYLRRVREASWKMSALIDDLLGLTRLTRTTLNRKDVDLALLATRTVSDLKSKARNRDFEFDCVDSAQAFGDPELLTLLLSVLIENAWKFTGGTDAARAEFLVERIGDETVYALRDNGVGFDMRYVDKLFHPFERLHRAVDFPGNGIGLATAHRIVAKHGGRIWAESAPGEGATIRFTLEPGVGER